MANTDFGSGSRSPGGWGGSGSAAAGGQGGMGGQKSSAGNYNYRGIPGTRAIGNYNTGGPLAGIGNQYGVNQNNGIQRGYPGTAGPTNRYIAQVPVEPLPPPVQPPAVDPVVGALTKRRPPPVTREDVPYIGALPGDPAPSYAPQRYVNPGVGVDPNGIGRVYSNISVPQGYATSNPPRYSNGQGYTNINKNNLGTGTNNYGMHSYGGRR